MSVKSADHSFNSSCLDDPNFATICSFIEKFGEICSIGVLSIGDLQEMLENTNDVHPILVQLHIKLLRRVFKSIQADKWERSLAKFGHTYSSQDGWEIERFGYKKSKMQTKLRLLKNLLESQFDCNVKFKGEVNKLPPSNLRLSPLGRDTEGQVYWLQVDDEASIRIYKEDIDDDTWEVVATNKDEMTTLIEQLKKGEVRKKALEDIEEELNGNGTETDPKEIILDTGKEEIPQESEEEEESDEEGPMEIDEFSDDDNELSRSSSGHSKTNGEIAPVDIIPPPQLIPEPSIPKEEIESKKELSMEPLEKSPEAEPEVMEEELPTLTPSLPLPKEVIESSVDLPEPPKEELKVELETKVENPSIKEEANEATEKETVKVEIKEEAKPTVEALNPRKSLEMEDRVKPEMFTPLKLETLKDVDSYDTESEMLIPSTSQALVPESETDKISLSLKIEIIPTADYDKSPRKFEQDGLSINPPIALGADEGQKLVFTLEQSEQNGESELEDSEIDSKLVNESNDELSSQIDENKDENSDQIPQESTSKVLNVNDKVDSKGEEEATVVNTEPLAELINESSPINEPNTDETKNDDILTQKISENIEEQSEKFSEPAAEVLNPASEESPITAQVKKSESTKYLEISEPPSEQSEIISNVIISSSDKESEKSAPEEKDGNLNETKPDENKEIISEQIVAVSSTVEKLKKDDYYDDIDSADSSDMFIDEEKKDAPAGLGALGNLGYDSSDEEEENKEKETESLKRKAEDEPSSSDPKSLKIEEKSEEKVEEKNEGKDPKENPIVGEAIEEEMILIVGEGAGKENEGGNEEVEADDEEISDSMEPVKPKMRGRPKKAGGRGGGGGAGRGRGGGGAGRGRPPGAGRKKKEVPVSISIIEDDSLNGDDGGPPVRQSRRIAQIRQKEEEDRRKLEEERLIQLKEAQIKKKLKEQDKTTKPDGKKEKKLKNDKNYLPTPSASDSESGEGGDEFEAVGKEKKKRKKRRKNGKGRKKTGNPWATSSDDDDEEDEEGVEEEEEEEHEEEEELVFNRSDHEFSPESDLGEDDEDFSPRHARTAKRGEEIVDKYATTNCNKCYKGDHPEWILLCDACDKGWHASCLRPQLWVIPEGEWHCPPCQHNMLVVKLDENLIEYDKLLKRRENEVLRKERLAYVGISLNNVIPSAPEIPEEAEPETNKHRKRRYHSDDEDELSGDFIDENSDLSASDVSEDEPIYKLRARKATKNFSFQEYDDMINSALREEDEENQNEVPNEKVEVPPELREEGAEAEENEVKESEGEGEEEVEGEGGIKSSKIKIVSDEEEVTLEELNRRKELLKNSTRKSRRRLNDLDATSEEDSDEDFKGSGGEDEEEELEEKEDSEWSGGKDDDESDDSIARVTIARTKIKKQGRLGRREKLTDSGTVRRSTRRRRNRVSYDESDEDEEEEKGAEWNSNTEEESEDEASGSGSDSESDDETWGKRKKRPPPPKKMSSAFFTNVAKLGKIANKKPPAKKKKKVDDEEVDRPWSNKHGNKSKTEEEPVERKTRGKKINFKDILDSGESDDDGNIRPKRRRVLSESDSDGPSSSKKLVAANNRAKMEKMEKIEVEEAAAAASAVVQPNFDHKMPSPSNAELKPVPAPPFPPKRSFIPSPVPMSQPPPPKVTHVTGAPEIMGLPSGATLVAKKSVPSPSNTVPGSGPPKPHASSPQHHASSPQQHTSSPQHHTSSPQHHMSSPHHISSPQPQIPNLPGDLTKIPNSGPGHFHNPPSLQNTPPISSGGLRPPFHPSWIRGGAPGGAPPPPYHTNSSPSIGKPPPLSNTPFMQQQQIPRPGYSHGPPPLRIPTPSTVSGAIPSFHQFKRDGPPMYGRFTLGPQQLLPGQHPGQVGAERFFVPPGGAPYYSVPPSNPQMQHHPLFATPPYEYRGEEGLGHPSAHMKEEGHSPGSHQHPGGPGADGEFGGLVSYFSQRSTEDMDS